MIERHASFNWHPDTGSRSILKLFLLFLVVNLGLYGMFSIWVVGPRISESVDSLRQTDLERTAAASAKEFDLFFSDRVAVIKDLAHYPYVINAVRLGGSIDPNLTDYLDTLRVFGQEPGVVLLDINQTPIFTTPDVDLGRLEFQAGWFESLLDGTLNHGISLFPGMAERFEYAVAVPVSYQGYVEGVLVVLLQGNMAAFSSIEKDDGLLLRLCNGRHCVQQTGEVPANARWISQPLDVPDMVVALMINPSLLKEVYRRVSSEATSLLLFAGMGAFALFALVSYPVLVRPYEALRAQTGELALLSSVMENAVEGVSHLNERGRFDFTNEAFERISGFSGAALHGHSWRKVVATADWPLVEQALESLEPKGKASLEVRGAGARGAEVYQSLTLVKAPAENTSLAGVFCFAKDISQRKNYEARLDRANQELTAFAYRTSHDLRAPLMSVKGLLDLAERTIQRGKLDLALQSIEKSRNALKRLDHTVDDVLELSRMDNLETVTADVDLDAMVSDILQQFCQLDNVEKISIEQQLEHSGPLVTEEARLQHIISNLVSNAIKYADMEENESVIRLAAASHNGRLQLAVEDNGIGIPEQARADVFGMFKRFHTQRAYGSGLGLYLVQKNAEALGGEIKYEALEKGSRFVLTIPQQREAV